MRSTAMPIRVSTGVLWLMYLSAVTADLALLWHTTAPKTAAFVVTLTTLALAIAYMLSVRPLKHPSRFVTANAPLLAYLMLFLGVQLLVHRLDLPQVARLLGYTGSALLTYGLAGPLLAEHDDWFETWLRIVALTSAVLGATAVASSLLWPALQGPAFSVKPVYRFLGFPASGGVLDHPLTMGTQTLLGLGSAVYLMRRRHSMGYAAMAALCASGLAVSMARGAWLAGVVGLVVVVLNRKPASSTLMRLAATMGVLALALGAIYLLVRLTPFLAALARLEMGTSHRNILWGIALVTISQRPLAGYGIGESTRLLSRYQLTDRLGLAADAPFHNTYLDATIDSGVVVGAIYALLFVVPILRCLRSRGLENGKRTFLLFMSTAALVSSLFIDYNVGGLRAASLTQSFLLGIANAAAIQRVPAR